MEARKELERLAKQAREEAKEYEKAAANGWTTADTQERMAYASAQGRAEGYADGIEQALSMLTA